MTTTTVRWKRRSKHWGYGSVDGVAERLKSKNLLNMFRAYMQQCMNEGNFPGHKAIMQLEFSQNIIDSECSSEYTRACWESDQTEAMSRSILCPGHNRRLSEPYPEELPCCTRWTWCRRQCDLHRASLRAPILVQLDGTELNAVRLELGTRWSRKFLGWISLMAWYTNAKMDKW